MRSPLAFGAVASTVALLAAGCGGSGKSTTSAASGSPYSEAQSTTSAASAPAGATSSTSAQSTTASAGVVVTTKHSKLGPILAAGPKRLTVYMFEGDKGSTSSCSGGCTQVWPPVTTAAGATVAGAAFAADLGTITRPDGTKQVTYKGHPLYFFSQDKDNGDAYGQGVKGFGASWYVLKPTGAKLDKS